MGGIRKSQKVIRDEVMREVRPQIEREFEEKGREKRQAIEARLDKCFLVIAIGVGIVTAFEIFTIVDLKIGMLSVFLTLCIVGFGSGIVIYRARKSVKRFIFEGYLFNPEPQESIPSAVKQSEKIESITSEKAVRAEEDLNQLAQTATT